MIQRRTDLLAAALLVAAMTTPAAAFCGFFVSGADTKLYANASQVVMMRKGTHTVMTMSNQYKGPTEDFAMVVPVPVVLHKDQVKTLRPEVFKAVDQLYAAWLPGLGVTALPARTAFAAASLPAGALVMLDVVAAFPVD